ncbi:MAG: murein biosynthesis integral membrane protein MurJ [Kiritimatiellia bacterium]
METRRLVRSFGTVSALTLLSRLFGLVRDVMTAGAFGTSAPISAFFVAFTIPNLFRRLFGEGALSSAFVPQFVKTLREKGPDSAWSLARKISSLLIATLGLLTVAGILGMQGLRHSGWLSVQWRLIMELGSIMLPYMILICLVALAMGILNSFHHFAIPAATPSLLNLVWIAALLWVCPLGGDSPVARVRILSFAILAAGGVQLALQFPKLRQHGWTPGWDADARDPAVRRVLLLTLPGAAGAAVTQINVLLDRVIATMAGGHGASSLNYAERLIYFPMGIFATALGTILLPVLAGHAANREADKASRTVRGALRAVLLVMTPAAAGILALAPEIVRLFYQRGQFNEMSAFYVTAALVAYAPLLLFASASKVLIPSFYAHQDTRTPFKVAVSVVVLHLLLSVGLFFALPVRLRHTGPAIGTTAAEILQFFVLAVLFTRRFGSPDWRAIGRALALALTGSLVMGLVARGLLTLARSLLAGLHLAPFATAALALLAAIAGAVTVYTLWLVAFRSEESLVVIGQVRRRLAR